VFPDCSRSPQSAAVIKTECGLCGRSSSTSVRASNSLKESDKVMSVPLSRPTLRGESTRGRESRTPKGGSDGDQGRLVICDYSSWYLQDRFQRR
ncbi:Hypothetical predicted protein, partial [Xyrichtys novacula]